MKTSKYVSGSGIEIEYILQKSNSLSKTLIVAFPAPRGGVRGGEWGYLVTIKKIADVNVLFLKTNAEYNKSRMILRDGKPIIEEAIISLVNQSVEKMGIEQIIAIGTSLGGYCSLYYGLKYNWDIISGAPPYTFFNREDEDIRYSLGYNSPEGRKILDNLLSSVIEKAGARKYNKKCFFFWGEGEPLWKIQSEAKQMIKDMDKYLVKYSYALYPFSSHQTVAEIFPNVMEKYLNYYLGKSEKPSENDEIRLPPNALMYKRIDEAYKRILECLDDCHNVEANLNIKNNIIFGYSDDQIVLRNYVYAKAGWFWGVGEDACFPGGANAIEPIKVNSFWDISTLKKSSNMLSFFFQSSILSWYKRHPSKETLDWLFDNAMDYMKALPDISQTRYVHMRRYDYIIHMLYFIELHKLTAAKLTRKEATDFSNEVERSLRLHLGKGWIPTYIRWEYKTVLGLLIVAAYYKNSLVYDNIYNAVLDILNAMNDYHFDKNGCCISGQMDYQDFLFIDVKTIMEFLDANEMGDNKAFQKAKRTYNKLLEFMSHVCQPNNKLPAVGHTGANQFCRSRKVVKHKAGNYIRNSSNIAFLEDEKSISYITINGGSNVHSNIRHCDLMSFIWNYDSKQIFYDAGGTGRLLNLEEYVSSSVAHNGFICDDINYVTPEYNDFTAIEEGFLEQEEFVMIPTSNILIEGVTLKRKFFWIKPNILIIIDEGQADKEREFTQNFLLGDFELNKKDFSNVHIKVSSDIEASILQHFASEDIKLKEYRGVNELGDDINPRGTIIENWRTPRRGLNLAYSKNGKEARFVTSIELHSKKLAADEQSLQSVNFDSDGNLIVVLGDGKIIYEKMPEKQ